MRAARVLCRAASAAAAEGRTAQPARAREPFAKFPDRGRKFQPSIEEALFLAKEAGVWTTREVQLQIVRSPPFSQRDRPFLLENFFEVPDADRRQDDEDEDFSEEEEEVGDVASAEADPVIHSAIRNYFRPDDPPRFWHSGEEWLARAEGRGTRKRASAHAVIRRGSGTFKVNGESDMFAWWPLPYHRFDVCQPFKLTGTAGVYDVFVEVVGGGEGGQAGAARLAIARALLHANPGCHDALQRGFCLLEDTRQKMSKMPGKKGARASFSWTKR